MEETWDGLPVSPEPPYGAAVLVWARTPTGPLFLLLHRAHLESPDARDWAWGPPAGARLPGEEIAACAQRELREETCLEAEIAPTEFGTPDWEVYGVELAVSGPVVLSEEHDRFLWATVADVRALVWPDRVQVSLVRLAETLADSDGAARRGQ